MATGWPMYRRPGGQSDVFVAIFEEDEPDQFLTTRITSAEESRELLGDWSPDGQWLVFSRQVTDQRNAGSNPGSNMEDIQGLWLRNPGGDQPVAADRRGRQRPGMVARRGCDRLRARRFGQQRHLPD